MSVPPAVLPSRPGRYVEVEKLLKMISPSSDPLAGPRAAPRETSTALRERVMSLQLPRGKKAKSGVSWLRQLAAFLVVAMLAAIVWQTAAGWFAPKTAATKPEVAGAAPAATSSTVDATKESANAGAPTAVAPSSATSAASAAPALLPKIAAADGKIVLESRGYLIPAHQILVSPKVQGMVTKLNLEEGRRVQKGEMLAEIESIEFERDYERALAMYELSKARLLEMENGSRPEEVSQAEATLNQAQEELVDIDRIYQRNRELWKSRSVTEAELQASESKHLATLQRVEQLKYALQLLRKGPREERIVAARAESRQYEADMLKAKWRLSNCVIVAPITGTILKKNAEEGNIVNPLAFNGSFSLCELADLSDLEVDLAIQERDVSKIFVGQMCRVRCEAYPKRVYEGYVSRLMPIADRAKGAVPVRVKVRVPAEEEGIYLKPEMGANVTFYDGLDPQQAAKK